MKRGSTLRRAGRAFCDRRHNGSPLLGEAAHIQPRFHLCNVVATQREAPMMRLVTSLGTLIALLAIAPAAEAGSYAFSIGGHRFQVEAPRNCPSASCVSVPPIAAFGRTSTRRRPLRRCFRRRSRSIPWLRSGRRKRL